MSYKYNNTRIKEFAEKNKLSGRAIATRMGMSNDLAPRGWIACTEKIYMHHFINFINTFGFDIHEFFYQDDVLMSEGENGKNTICSNESGSQSVPSDNSALKLAHVKEMAELEKKHIREMMQKDIDLARQEAKMREEIRRELKAEFEQDKQTLVDNYEARLRNRDADVAKLQRQLAELTLQYKELEAARNEKSYLGYGGVTGLAEPGAARK
jgi:transcriptional regulator with XRE-family HTH domain